MTLPRVRQLIEYWRDNPPAHVALRIAFLKKKTEGKSVQEALAAKGVSVASKPAASLPYHLQRYLKEQKENGGRECCPVSG